jgi:chemotaxis protein histidine kinase CheA
VFDPRAFLDEFREEAREHLSALDAHLMTFEREPSNPAPLRDMFISAHSIKGGAAMLELAHMRDVAHAVEDVLAHLRDNHQPLDSDTADLLFRALDALRVLIERSTPGDSSAADGYTTLVDALHRRTSESATGLATGAQHASPDHPRVLLLEDSITVRLLNSKLLSEAGCEVVAVSDGLEAAELLQTESYDLLVTSLETRGIRGLELVARVRTASLQNHIPIVIFSSDGTPRAREQAAELGVDAFVQKGSFGHDGLVKTVQALLEPRLRNKP